MGFLIPLASRVPALAFKRLPTTMDAVRRIATTSVPLGAWILIAVATNIVLAAGGGYGFDVGMWARWTDELQVGYSSSTADYPPVFMHWLWLCGKLLALLHLPVEPNALLRLLAVTPVVVCHVVLLLVIDQHLRAFPDSPCRNWLLGFTALNPAILVDGPAWGQVDLLFSTILVLALNLLITGRALVLVLPLLMLSVLTKFQAICIVPVVLPLLWMRRSSTLWAGALIALFLCEVVLLPYSLAGSTSAVFRSAYLSASTLYPFASLNADNLWYLLGLNQVSDRHPLVDLHQAVFGRQKWFTPRVVGETMYVVWSSWLLISALAQDEAAGHWRNAMLSALGFFLLLPDMHERYLFAAVVIALVAAAQHPSLLRHAIALSVLAALNMLLVLAHQESAFLSFVLSGALVLYGLLWVLQPLLARLPLQWLLRLPTTAWMSVSLLIWVLAVLVRVSQASPLFETGWSDATQVAGRTESQGWGTLHIGRSVEGNNLRVGQQIWHAGFGTHGPSAIHLPIPLHASRFATSVGLDDEVSNGLVAFQILADGEKLWDSGPMRSGEAPRTANVDIRGRQALDLIVDPIGNNDFDHADWLMPRFQTKS